MPPIAQLTPIQIRRKIETIENQLEEMSPALWQERTLLLKQLDLLEKGNHALFTGMRRPFHALCLCLDLRDHAMTQDEVFEMLQKGGWPIDKPLAFRGSLNDLLNYHSGLKTTVPKKPPFRRMGEYFGRTEWPDSKFQK